MHQFQSIFGQAQAIELLQQAIIQGRIAPAYLFVGPEGVGKRLTAKAFAEILLGQNSEATRNKQRVLAGNHPDLLWIEPTYQHQGKLLTPAEAEKSGLKRRSPPLIRIEQIREINQFLSRPPLEAERAVIVMEEAQAMNEGAANALLKTLEEPGRATLILLAPSLDSLLTTLVSRCQRIPFSRLDPDCLAEILIRIDRGEVMADPALMGLAQGSPGLLLQAWEQLELIPPELRETLLNPPKTALDAFTRAKLIENSLDTPLQLWLIDYLQYCYWQTYQNSTVLSLLEKTRQQLLAYVQPRLVWECTLLKLAHNLTDGASGVCHHR